MSQPPLGITARAVVSNIVDGDTLDVLVFGGIPVRIRLYHCWAPEITGTEKPLGLVAKSQLEKMAPVGSRVRVNIPTGDTESLGKLFSFDRILGYVWREGDSDDLSTLMVASGVASYERKAWL